jgi:hypothetical protein
MSDDKTIELWAFAGERVGADGKTRVHAWYDVDGAELRFKASRGERFTVGGEYRVTVKRGEGNAVQMYGNPRPEYAGKCDERHYRELAGWQAADMAARARQAARTAEARAAKEGTSDELSRALDVIRKHALRQRTSADRAGFIGTVVENITRLW